MRMRITKVVACAAERLLVAGALVSCLRRALRENIPATSTKDRGASQAKEGSDIIKDDSKEAQNALDIFILTSP
jgi:hypothetical protein